MGEGSGFPETCAGCGGNDWEKEKAPRPGKVSCPTCGKRVKKAGLDNHIRDAHGQSSSLPNKLVKRLESVRRFTDQSSGMYRGTYWDDAPNQFQKLQRLGLVTVEYPHNPVHKERVVITDKGRAVLAFQEGDTA